MTGIGLSPLRSGEGVFHAPTVADSGGHQPEGESTNLGPLRKRLGSALERDASVRSGIPHLGFTVGPCAVSRTVRPIVVDAIEAGTGRTFAHVGVKVGELQPPLADGDASPAVVGVGLVVRVTAPVQHPKPSYELASPGHAVFGSRERFDPVRARLALGRMTAGQIGTGPGVDGFALAAAFPKHLAAGVDAAPRKNLPVSEAFPGQVFRWRHVEKLPRSNQVVNAGVTHGPD